MSHLIKIALAILLLPTAALTGCGMGALDRSGGGSTSSLRGSVFGGQQPVVGATIQLYTAGSSGNASAAIPMLTPLTPVLSVAGGNFDISGDYTCGKSSGGTTITNSSDQVYIVATGGDPGLTQAADNAAIVLMAALGPCSSLATNQFIEINEVTTAAAAWALAPFITSYTNVGATQGNVSGITNAFLDAALLADTSTGLAAALPSNLTIETNKLYALANSIASCVNSDGGTGCSPLFTAATPTPGVPPTDTLSAALNVVKNPGQNVNAVYQAAGSFPPFPSKYTKAPNDWTMTLTVKGGGMLDPTALALDAEGNVWVVGQNSPLSEFSPQGTPANSTGFASGEYSQADGIAIDTNDNIWIPNYNASYNSMDAGSVTEVLGTKSGSPGTVVFSNGNPGFTDGIYYPFAVAADTNGNIFVANNGNGTVTVLTDTGSIYTNGDNVSGYQLGGYQDAFPFSVAIDASHGFWLPDDNRGVRHVSADGVELNGSADCCFGSYGVATDSYGNVWVANHDNDSFSEVAANGSTAINQSTVGGIETPEYVAVDAGQNVWFSNSLASTVTEIAGNAGPLPVGTAISPSIGTYGTMEAPKGGYGRDAALGDPSYIAPDRSGNIWVTDENGNKVVMFFGLATPTVTPIQPVPAPPQ